MDTIFKFLHSIMFTLTLQISKLTKAVVSNSLPHERFWQFVYNENARYTRLMQRSFTSCNTTKVRALDVIVPRPSININAKRISITRIYFAFFWGEQK